MSTPHDRRRPGRQHPVAGGRRATDPPLTTRDAASWMGVGVDYIRDAIAAGELKAEHFGRPGKRRIYRIHLDEFIVFLRTIKFRRLPKARP